ncbi:MAG TPA: hypothetical protein VGF62_03320 [Rhizomicrobium sp.]|jgi:hypothetical protein
MPKTVAQWTGLAVTVIVVFGCDLDVLYALPLGLMAGAVAAAVIEVDDLFRARSLRPIRIQWRPQPRRIPDR